MRYLWLALLLTGCTSVYTGRPYIQAGAPMVLCVGQPMTCLPYEHPAPVGPSSQGSFTEPRH